VHSTYVRNSKDELRMTLCAGPQHKDFHIESLQTKQAGEGT